MNPAFCRIVAFALLACCRDFAAHALADEFSNLRLNEIQVIGSHNSYKQGIDPGLLEIVSEFSTDQASALDYSHIPLTDQLNLGLRGFEFDVFYDPEGGRFADPLGRRMQKLAGKEMLPYDSGPMSEPGFKVLHSQDIDFRSSCPLLRDALRELRQWSEAHPKHLPVVITFNAKAGPSVVPGGVEALPFSSAAFDQWDALAFQELGRAKVLTPDDVRGKFASLEEAVLSHGWPRLESCRGKFLLVLDETGTAHDLYCKGHRSLEGRSMFTTSPPGTHSAAALIINDPIKDASTIRRRVEQGYLVRTRADADTREARDRDLRRFAAAKESGAQVISTDFYVPDRRLSPDYVVRFAEGVFSRRNPVAPTTAK